MTASPAEEQEGLTPVQQQAAVPSSGPGLPHSLIALLPYPSNNIHLDKSGSYQPS